MRHEKGNYGVLLLWSSLFRTTNLANFIIHLVLDYSYMLACAFDVGLGFRWGYVHTKPAICSFLFDARIPTRVYFAFFYKRTLLLLFWLAGC